MDLPGTSKAEPNTQYPNTQYPIPVIIKAHIPPAFALQILHNIINSIIVVFEHRHHSELLTVSCTLERKLSSLTS